MAWQPWLAALTAIGAGDAGLTFRISAAAVKPSDWTVERLQTELATEIKPIQYRSHGALHTFNCVPLVSLLKAAGVGTDFSMQAGANPKLKNPAMRQAVVVTGRDGYAVVFSLAEILPSVGNRAIWVAFDEDGQPLSGGEGPVRLIVPEDKSPARGVHQIASIDVVQLAAPATEP
ncbi:MAG: hypothetical protein ABSF29_06440 [Tepidisphaeraceae bacterium]|jgi:hypothetical protein